MTQTKATTLHSYCAKEQTLGAAIATCQTILKGAIALLYSPQSCQLARLSSDGTLRLADNSVIDPADDMSIFEARIFNDDCELRWLNRNSGRGDVALLSESPQSVDGFAAVESIECESLEQQYLLWGKYWDEKAKNKAVNEGWLRLAEARIGKLEVPLEGSLNETQRVYLKTSEYLAVVGQYSNFAVIEERLVRLEVK